MAKCGNSRSATSFRKGRTSVGLASPARAPEMDFFEEFSGLAELKSPEASRRRLWLARRPI